VNRVIDYSALLYPIPHARLEEYKARAKAGLHPWAKPQYSSAIATVGILIALVMALSVGIGVFTVVAGAGFGTGAAPVGVLGSLLMALWVGGIVAVAVSVIRKALRAEHWEKWLRLETFANANGFAYRPVDSYPNYPGAIFSIGDTRLVTDHLTSTTDRFIDMGNYQYTVGSGDDRKTRTWGFLALHLDRRLPHMVLDAKANNGLFGASNLPASFDRSQVLSLEGDFDKHFTLYCPRRYERDALYVFTPDLMALLIDHAAPYDVEIVDDWMFVYSQKPFEPTSPHLYQRLFRIIDTVGAKTLRQTDRYSDERVGDFAANYVAPQGQRLKRGLSWGAIVAIAVFAIIWVLPNLIPFLGLFVR
jgi:hypothetical protein